MAYSLFDRTRFLEPNLLIPGKKPVGPVKIANWVFQHPNDTVILFNERGGKPRYYRQGGSTELTISNESNGAWVRDGYNPGASGVGSRPYFTGGSSSGDFRAANTVIVQFRMDSADYSRIIALYDTPFEEIRAVTSTHLEVYQASYTGAVADGLPHTLVASRSGAYTASTLNSWYDGNKIKTNASHSMAAAAFVGSVWVGNDDSLDRPVSGSMRLVAFLHRVLPEALSQKLSIDPWLLVKAA